MICCGRSKASVARENGGEFGGFLRVIGGDDDGLLRDADLEPEQLIQALTTRFEGLGAPEHTVVFRPDGHSRWWTKDRRFWMASSSPLRVVDANETEAFEKLCIRQQMLRDRLIRDLESGSRIFVYRNVRRTLQDAELAQLHAAVRAYGPAALLYVRHADQQHLAGSVNAAGPGLVVGALDRFSISSNNDQLGPDHDAWRALCQTA
jgi:hypothetical protein